MKVKKLRKRIPKAAHVYVWVPFLIEHIEVSKKKILLSLDGLRDDHNIPVNCYRRGAQSGGPLVIEIGY